MSGTIHIHPSVDQGVKPGSANFAGGTLVCKCAQSPVKVAITGNVAYDHACGCTKCWKPAGATFSVVAVVPRANLNVTENANKLAIADQSALHGLGGWQVEVQAFVELGGGGREDPRPGT